MKQNNVKRLCYYHNKDLDGFFSGAVIKYKFPDVELRGWDYKDPVPNFEEMEGFDEIILIDITFPLDVLQYIGEQKNLTVIDHHISFKKQVDGYIQKGIEESTVDTSKKYPSLSFEYIFDDKMSACELGFKHYFGYVPPIVELVGKYDTWRANGTDEWEDSVLPMKYYLYGKVNKPEDVNELWFMSDKLMIDFLKNDAITIGKSIMEYERKMDESKTNSYSFEKEVFGGLKALCINTNFMSSETMITKFDSSKHDLMIGFAYNGKNWGVSLRSVEGGVDVSEIAKARNGGGHKGAAGYEAKIFEEIFV